MAAPASISLRRGIDALPLRSRFQVFSASGFEQSRGFASQKHCVRSYS